MGMKNITISKRQAEMAREIIAQGNYRATVTGTILSVHEDDAVEFVRHCEDAAKYLRSRRQIAKANDAGSLWDAVKDAADLSYDDVKQTRGVTFIHA